MREIKFRIRLKNKNDGKEITLYNSVFDAMNGIAFYEIDRGEWQFLSADEYTGLKDKNGKEIYESDIVSFENIRDDEFNKGFVFFADGSFKLNVDENWFMPLLIKENEVAYHTTFEIIGNIYQNPELLK